MFPPGFAPKKGVTHGQEESKKGGKEKSGEKEGRQEIQKEILLLPLERREPVAREKNSRAAGAFLRDPLSMTPPQFTQHPILFEDKDLLAISKPEGVLSHPNPGSKGEHTAFEGPYDPQRRCFKTPAGELWLLHRLDQDTSGVLLAVKSTRAAEICRKAFDERRVKKHYVALVSRRPMPPHGIWRDTLIERRSGESVRVTAVRSGAPNAFLNYKMKEFFPRLNLALLEIELLTGKTHQIRVQASFRGHPVAGDRVYGNFTVNKELRQKLELRRLFLHAWRLVLPHPSSGKPVTIDSPLPEALEDCLARTK